MAIVLPFTSPLNGGLVNAANLNILQTGSQMCIASLISQRANFSPWVPSSTYPGSGVTVSNISNSIVAGGNIWEFQGSGDALFNLGPLLPVDCASASLTANTARPYLGRIWAAQGAGLSNAFYAGVAAYNDAGSLLGYIYPIKVDPIVKTVDR